MTEAMMGLDRWLEFLGAAEIPVLKQTARELAALREDVASLDTRSIAQVIKRDPMMTVKLLNRFQRLRSRSGSGEIVQVEQALMMLGMNPFFEQIPARPIVEDLLRGNIDALAGLLRVVRRSRRAAAFATEWAAQRVDLHYEDIRIAALLHDLAELLMWCFAPDRMLDVRRRQLQDSTLRSRAAQEAVFGVALADLQAGLARMWVLPELLLKLMDDACNNEPRVRNVMLAVDLARHSADGWTDAALPDDYARIADLLRVRPEEVKAMVGALDVSPGE
ncbi:MAG TPA: HDOD domain-containing protein [Casimicrobiaceae bacterium]|nr:HDOD domain-containing protein [Casimicrobiaceae bacterium]